VCELCVNSNIHRLYEALCHICVLVQRLSLREVEE